MLVARLLLLEIRAGRRRVHAGSGSASRLADWQARTGRRASRESRRRQAGGRTGGRGVVVVGTWRASAPPQERAPDLVGPLDSAWADARRPWPARPAGEGSGSEARPAPLSSQRSMSRARRQRAEEGVQRARSNASTPAAAALAGRHSGAVGKAEGRGAVGKAEGRGTSWPVPPRPIARRGGALYSV